MKEGSKPIYKMKNWVIILILLVVISCSSVRYIDSNLTAIDQSQKGQIPANHHMLKIYPNPFNPETMIQFVLPRKSDVKLTVYNINGRVIKELVRKNMPAGEQIVKWNGKNRYSQEVSTGVYIAKIEMGTPSGSLITDSTKLILVR